MARARNIKPGFFTNDALGELEPIARLLFIGLWTMADREGRVEDRPKKIRAQLFPYDDCKVDDLLDSLAGAGFILRYETKGLRCLQVVNWHKHQSPHHMEVPSDIPPPDGTENRFNHAPLTKKQRETIMRRDKGKCVICGTSKRLHIDHIVPVTNGGSSDDSNLRVLCETCNCSKGKNKSISTRRQSVVDSISNSEQVDNESSSNKEQVERTVSHPTDSLIPYKEEEASQGRDIQGLQGDPPPRTRAHVSAREGVAHG